MGSHRSRRRDDRRRSCYVEMCVMATRFESPRAQPLAYKRPEVYVTSTRTKFRVAITGLSACLVLIMGAVIVAGAAIVLFSSFPRIDLWGGFALCGLCVLGMALIGSGTYNLVWAI